MAHSELRDADGLPKPHIHWDKSCGEWMRTPADSPSTHKKMYFNNAALEACFYFDLVNKPTGQTNE